MPFSSIVVIALLQSNTFCTLPTDNKNVSDGKENGRETNRKSHPAIDYEVYERNNELYWKGAVTDMRYFARSKLSRNLVHKKNFSLIWQVVFKLGYVFCQER